MATKENLPKRYVSKNATEESSPGGVFIKIGALFVLLGFLFLAVAGTCLVDKHLWMVAL